MRGQSRLMRLLAFRLLLARLTLLVLSPVLCEPCQGATDFPGGEPSESGAQSMRIGFYVNAIRHVDWEQRRFRADVYWWLRYKESGNDQDRQLIEAVEFVNADVASVSQKLLERKVLPAPDGPYVYSHYRTIADFHFDAEFHRYPFDAQTLPIVIEHETLPASALEFVDDVSTYKKSSVAESRWGISCETAIPDFDVQGVTRCVSRHHYDTNFGDVGISASSFECSRMTLAIRISRVVTPYLVKIMIPLAICLLLPYLVFFIPAVNLEVASGLTVTSLLACVAMQLTVVPGLPNVGYVVTSDLFFYLAYLLSMLAMAQTVWTYMLEKGGYGTHATRLDLAGRVLYPLIFILGSAWIIRG